MSQEDPEVTEFYAEEEDDPVETVEKQGKITFSFSIMNIWFFFRVLPCRSLSVGLSLCV